MSRARGCGRIRSAPRDHACCSSGPGEQHVGDGEEEAARLGRVSGVGFALSEATVVVVADGLAQRGVAHLAHAFGHAAHGDRAPDRSGAEQVPVFKGELRVDLARHRVREEAVAARVALLKPAQDVLVVAVGVAVLVVRELERVPASWWASRRA